MIDAAPGGSRSATDLERLFDLACDAHEGGELDTALTGYLSVLHVDREHVGALAAAALIHAERHEWDLAELLARRSMGVSPTVPAACTLGRVLLGRRQFDEAIVAYRAAVGEHESELGPSAWANLLFALDLHPEASPALRLAERRAFDERYCRALTEAAAPHVGTSSEQDRDPERPLRVGYVSADVKQHSAAHCFGPVLTGHRLRRGLARSADRRSAPIVTYLYDTTERPPSPDDLVAPWLRGQVDEARQVAHLKDATLAALIRHDRIDVLVDLSGYTAGSRPLLFARKPAPIQLSGLGYAAGLGISAMDGLLCDRVVVPPASAWQYDEPLVYLPSYIPFDPAPPWPAVAPPPRLTHRRVTFGYLGRPVRISDATLGAWADILRAVPGSRLLLKGVEYDDPHVRRGLQVTLFALGIDPDRVTFKGATSRPDHLAAYAEVDIGLDPFPHNGGVTTLESILMGVPVVTLAGTSICGRGGASLMTTLGLEQNSAATPSAYVGRAVALASPSDSGTTELDRPSLRTRLLDSLLVDHERYAADLEDAYRELWRARCRRDESVS